MLTRGAICLWLQFFAVVGVLAAPSKVPTTCKLTLRGAVVQLGCTGPNITVHASPELFEQLNKTRTGFKVELDNHAKVGLPAPYMLAIQEQPGVTIIFKDSLIENVEVPAAGDPLNLITIFRSNVRFEGLVMRNCSTSHYYQWLIRLQMSTVTINGSRFEGNRCSNGILGSSDGPMTLSSTTFSDNVQLEEAYMLWMGSYLNVAPSRVLDCTFRNNSGAQAMLLTIDTVPVEFRACRIVNNGLTGGIILQVLNGAAVTVRNSTIDGSKRLDGPAVVAEVAKHSTLTMYDSVIKGAAAVTVTDSELALYNCSLSGNTAQGPYTGGAVHLAANSSFTATATTFRDNSAALGGAVMAMLLNDVRLVDCSFANNSAQYGSGSRGGAISLQASNKLIATRTKFRNNSADVGGAIAGIGTNEVLLQGCTFAANAASDSGGAVYMTNPAYTASSQCNPAGATSFGNLSMTSCSFQGNTAGAAGGAAFVNNGITVASRSARFGSNAAVSGSGGAVALGEGSTWQDANSNYSSNQAAKGGAAQLLQAATATFSACAFSGNNASEGGAVQVDAGAVALEGGSLTGNEAWKGGALLARRAAKVDLRDGVEVVGNRARQFGGGILLDSECNQQADIAAYATSACGAPAPSELEAEQDCPPPTRLEDDGSTLFRNNTADLAGPDIYQVSTVANETLAALKRLQGTGEGGQRALAGSAASLLTPEAHVGDYVSSDDSYLRIVADVLDTWKQRVAVDPVTGKAVQVLLSLSNTSGAAGALLLGQTQAAADDGIAILKDVGLRAPPGDYQLILEALNAPVAKSTVRVKVRACVPGEVTLQDRPVCLRCAAGQYSIDPKQSSCRNCPAHATCPGGAVLLPDKGYWQSSPRSLEVHKCLQASACKGITVQALQCAPGVDGPCKVASNATQYQALQCDVGYNGNLCGKCEADERATYGRLHRFKCVRCRNRASTITVTVVVELLVCVLVVALVVVNVLRDSEAPVQAGDYLKVVIRHLQHILLLSFLDANWHRSFSWLITASRWVLTSTGSGDVSTDCLLPARPGSMPRALAAKLLSLLLPLSAMLPVAAGTLLLYKRIKRSVVTREHRSAHGASQAMQSVTPVTIGIVMVVTLLSFFYCSLANQILGMFYCLRLDSHAGSPASWRFGYWTGDLDMRCYRGWHLTLVTALGIPGMLLLCLGIPAFCILLLLRTRQRTLSQTTPSYQYGFLSACYRPELWFWESVRQVQLLAVVACVVFTPLLQLAGQTGLLLLLLTAIIFAHVMLAPFKDETLNSTELASLMVTFANVCGAQIIGSCTPEHQNSWRSVMVAAGMLALNVALLAWIARAAAASRNVQWRQVGPAAGQAVRRLRAQLQKSISGPGV